MKFFLVTNTQKKHALTISKKYVKAIENFGAEVFVQKCLEKEFEDINVKLMEDEKAFEYCDVIITVGGDGTILRVARQSLKYNKPILGVNVGTLGFLAAIEPNESSYLKNIIEGNYFIDKRSILEIEIDDDNEKKLVLNDFVIGKASVLHTVGVKIYCDDVLVNDYSGDGVIISTPTGSTAYSLSAGGPILDAKVNGIVVTPLCAHSMRSPPMVFSKERNIKVIVNSNGRSDFFCSCDGLEEIKLKDECVANIRYSKQFMNLICISKTDQFKAIDKKLRGR